MTNDNLTVWSAIFAGNSNVTLAPAVGATHYRLTGLLVTRATLDQASRGLHTNR